MRKRTKRKLLVDLGSSKVDKLCQRSLRYHNTASLGSSSVSSCSTALLKTTAVAFSAFFLTTSSASTPPLLLRSQLEPLPVHQRALFRQLRVLARLHLAHHL